MIPPSGRSRVDALLDRVAFLRAELRKSWGPPPLRFRRLQILQSYLESALRELEALKRPVTERELRRQENAS